MIIQWEFREEDDVFFYNEKSSYWMKREIDSVLKKYHSYPLTCIFYYPLVLLTKKTLEKFICECMEKKENIFCYDTKKCVMELKYSKNVRKKVKKEEEFLSMAKKENYEEIWKKMNARTIAKLKKKGVFILDASSTFIAPDCQIGTGTYLFPDVEIMKKSKIGKNNFIGPHVVLVNFTCDCYNVIRWFHGENSKIGHRNQLGPFTHFRDNVLLENENVIGNFNELKSVSMKSGNKMKHLSYFGNTEMEKNINVGCGVITANYNGKKKEAIQIREGAFIGCNSTLIAPVTIKKDAYIAANTVVTRNVEEDEFAISRPELITKPRYHKK